MLSTDLRAESEVTCVEFDTRDPCRLLVCCGLDVLLFVTEVRPGLEVPARRASPLARHAHRSGMVCA